MCHLEFFSYSYEEEYLVIASKLYGYIFRVAYDTISKVVREICEAIIAAYEVMVCLSTYNEWK